MFLRVKKSPQSGGRMKYSFMIVENRREDGVVRQSVVKYLSSHTNRYAGTGEVAESQRAGRDERLRRENDVGRLFFWLDVYRDLGEVEELADKLPEITGRIHELVPFPGRAALDAWEADTRRLRCAFYGARGAEEAEQIVADVTEQYKAMCSAYGCRGGREQ